MGIKERQTKILISLFLLSDVDFTPIKLDKRLQNIFDISLNQKTRGTISGMLKEGLIKKTEYVVGQENASNMRSESEYSLTDKGFQTLCLRFPFFRFLKEKWDNRWRIISYEIPEARREIRDRLRREMQGWGLGPWHRSFWLTPHPILDNLRTLVTQKEEEKYIQAFAADHSFGNREVLIEKVWKTSLLDKKYRELFKEWHEMLSKDLPAGRQAEPKTEKLKKVVNNYVNILKEDPGLPKELIGEKWIGFEAFNIFKEIRSILLS